MFEKKGKIVLLLLYIVFPLFNTETSARSLTDEEKTRLYDSLKGQSYVDLTIDVSLTEEVVTMPEAVNKIKHERIEETKRLRKKLNSDSITLVSVGIPLLDGSEIRLSETRTRIGTGLKLRNDTTIFANTEKTETNREATTINTGYAKDSPSYEIDHKLKRWSIWSGSRWSGRKVLRFGKLDEPILMDIVRLCNPKSHAKPSKNKDFSYKGTGKVGRNACLAQTIERRLHNRMVAHVDISAPLQEGVSARRGKSNDISQRYRGHWWTELTFISMSLR